MARALRRDLATIQPGSQPTETQVQALSADLGKLFLKAEHQPTVTLDYLAARLADATAQGHFAAEDLRTVAHRLTSILSGSPYVATAKASALKIILVKSGAERNGIKKLIESLDTLTSNSLLNNYSSDTASTDLKDLSSESRGYLHAQGYTYLITSRGPTSLEDYSLNPVQPTRSLNVGISQVPLGKYHVSVTTKTSSQPIELGAFRVREGSAAAFATAAPGAITAADNPISGTDESDDPAVEDSGSVVTTLVPITVDPPIAAPTYERSGFVSFGDASFRRPLPAGLSLADITGITITDGQGVQRLSGDLLDFTELQSSHSLTLRIDATTAAPTARGSIFFSSSQGVSYRDKNFLLTADGLPSDASLTLSINGSPVAQVTTGPTGSLFVTLAGSRYTRSPKSKDVVNVLPDTADLFTAESFTLSDAQGNVLASAGF